MRLFLSLDFCTSDFYTRNCFKYNRDLNPACSNCFHFNVEDSLQYSAGNERVDT